MEEEITKNEFNIWANKQLPTMVAKIDSEN
jgi:hypothetical protein